MRHCEESAIVSVADDEAISRDCFASLAMTKDDTDILWDKIASIEYCGYEHVYDIEVEGTHNFIGNGIFAHNTAITGGEPTATATSMPLADEAASSPAQPTQGVEVSDTSTSASGGIQTVISFGAALWHFLRFVLVVIGIVVLIDQFTQFVLPGLFGLPRVLVTGPWDIPSLDKIPLVRIWDGFYLTNLLHVLSGPPELGGMRVMHSPNYVLFIIEIALAFLAHYSKRFYKRLPAVFLQAIAIFLLLMPGALVSNTLSQFIFGDASFIDPFFYLDASTGVGLFFNVQDVFRGYLIFEEYVLTPLMQGLRCPFYCENCCDTHDQREYRSLRKPCLVRFDYEIVPCDEMVTKTC